MLDQTGGLPYDRVEATQGYKMERYENPAAVVARRLRSLERGVCAAMAGKQKKAEAEQKNISVASAQPKGTKLKVCRKTAAHHTAQVAPAAEAPAAAAVVVVGGQRMARPGRSRVDAPA